jgi:Zn-dependent M28 family amino/carboxypeptidase
MNERPYHTEADFKRENVYLVDILEAFLHQIMDLKQVSKQDILTGQKNALENIKGNEQQKLVAQSLFDHFNGVLMVSGELETAFLASFEVIK